MKPSIAIQGAILGLIVLVGGLQLILLNSPSMFDRPEYSSFNDTISEAISDTESTKNSLEASIASNPNPGVLGVLNSLIQTVWSTISSIPTYLGVINVLLTSMVGVIGLGSYANLIIGLLWSMLIIGVVFAIFGAIFQKDL